MGAPEVEVFFQLKMFFSLLLMLLTPLALAWRPAPGIPLDRQLPVKSRQGWSWGYGEEECDFEPYHQVCHESEIWCDGGYYNGNSCWAGNYCLQQVSNYDGCPGVCHTPCDWETEDFCDMGYKTLHTTFGQLECWVGNWCQDKSLGGCPSVAHFESDYYGYGGYGGYGGWGYGGYGGGYGSGSSCYEAHAQECSHNEISCDAGYDSLGCWYGNYCIQEVNDDGCYGVCGQDCNYETEDWCDMGFDSNGCWMGNWCQDKSEGGCPPAHYGSETATGYGFGSGSAEDVCAHVTTWHETCNGNQTSCDLGFSPEHCWYGNYCVDTVDYWGCPGRCPKVCDWRTEEWCDLGYDGQEGQGWSGEGCWMGNWCRPIGGWNNGYGYGAGITDNGWNNDCGYGAGAPSAGYGMPPSGAPSASGAGAPSASGAGAPSAGLMRSDSSCYSLSERDTALERAAIKKV